MATKKAKAAKKGKPAKGKPAAKAKQALRGGGLGGGKKAAAAKSRRRVEESVPLPGMEQVRHRVLDKACEAIGQTRDAINDLKQEEAGIENQALRDMRIRDVSVYKHAGITLIRVVGEETLMVKKTREPKATASAGVKEDAGPTDDAGVTADEVDPGEAGEVASDLGDE